MAESEQVVRQRMEDAQPLVHSLAATISRNIPMRIDREDLIAYGQLGLAEAARDFEPQRGVQFTTFAYYRIRGAIYDGVSKMSWTSRARYNRLRYEHLANEALRAANEDPSTPAGVSLQDDLRWLQGAAEQLGVVYLISGAGDESGLPESALEDPGQPPASIAASREISARLRELVETLPPAERRLIRTIYFEGSNLQDAATLLGISKSWASRMHAKALEQLAGRLRRIGVVSPY